MKKYLALLLCAALLTSALPMAVLGADDLPESPSAISASEEQETQEPPLLTSEGESSLPEEPESSSLPEETPPGEEEQPPTDQEPPSQEETPSPEEPPVEEEPVDPSQPLFPLQTANHTAFISGSGDQVRPGDGLRRSEAAKILYLLLEDPVTPGGNHFSDVPAGAWYATYVNALTEMGILEGYGEDQAEFRPDKTITRAEFVTMLSRLYPLQTGDVSFTDVDGDSWAYEAIANAVVRGWASGYPDGSFRPGNPITRAEAIKLINKVLGRKADQHTIDAQGKFLLYTDLAYNHWAYYEIMEASVPHAHTVSETGVETWGAYTLPTTEHAPGPLLVDGELYYVDSSRHLVRSAKVGLLQFNSAGRYTTGNPTLDAKLTAIIRRQVDPSQSLYTNLNRLYWYVINNYSYLPQSHVAQGSTGWEPTYALNILNRGRGNCYSYAALFSYLAQKLGYQAKAVSGMATVQGSSHWAYGYWDDHGWVEIALNGTTYVCDPQMRDGHAAAWGYNWDLFMKPYGHSVAHYRVNGVVLG